MKSPIFLALLVLGLTVSSFETASTSDLNSKIQNYFTSLNVSKKQGINSESLRVLKDNIELSDIDYRHRYLITGDNGDAVAFAHIILYSWLKEKRFNKIDLVSCTTSPTITEAGLETLKEIGYEVLNGNGIYTVSYSNKRKALKLKLYSCSDKTSNQPMDMKLNLVPGTSTNELSTSTLHYVGQGKSKEMFESIATDLYSVIQVLKK